MELDQQSQNQNTNYHLGVDFGTTKTAAVLIVGSKSIPLKLDGEHLDLPSFAAIPKVYTADRQVILGRKAKERLLPECDYYFIAFYKRLLDKRDEEMGRYAAQSEFQLVEGPPQNPQGCPANISVVDQDGKEFGTYDRPPYVSWTSHQFKYAPEFFLMKTMEHIKGKAAEYIANVLEDKNVDVSKDVHVNVTVPAYFGSKIRLIYRTIGKKLFASVRITNEPTAAAIALIEDYKEKNRAPGIYRSSRPFVVVDVGGGTTDLTYIIEKDSEGDKSYEVAKTGGDKWIGGVDFDRSLLIHFYKISKKQQSSALTARILPQLEAFRKELNQRYIEAKKNGVNNLDDISNKITLDGVSFELTWAEFRQEVVHEIERLQISILGFFTDIKDTQPLAKDGVTILLAGSFSQMDLILDIVSQASKETWDKNYKIHKVDNSKLLYLNAEGAGIIYSKNIHPEDLCHSTIGLLVEKPNLQIQPLVFKNTKLPHQHKEDLMVPDGSAEMNINFILVETSSVDLTDPSKGRVYLGVQMEHNPKKSRAKKIKFIIKIDAEGVIKVDVELHSHRPIRYSVNTDSFSNLVEKGLIIDKDAPIDNEETVRDREEARKEQEEDTQQEENKEQEDKSKKKSKRSAETKKPSESKKKSEKEDRDKRKKQQAKDTKKKPAEDEARRKQVQEDIRRKQEEEEARRKQAQEDIRRKQEEEEARRKQVQEDIRRKQEEEVARRKQEEEEAKRKRADEEARQAEEEDRHKDGKFEFKRPNNSSSQDIRDIKRPRIDFQDLLTYEDEDEEESQGY